MTRIGDLLVEYKEKPVADSNLPVLTLTEKNGFVYQSDRFNKRLATEDTSKYKVVRKGDIAFNPYLLWAGALAQNSLAEAGVISPLYPTFHVREGYDPRYVGRLLLSPQLVAAYDGIAFGSVPRRRRSSVKDFLSLPLPEQPPLDEQRRIAAILDHADALRAKRRQALAQLDALPQALFHKMFDGARDVTVPFGKVAEVQGGLQVSGKRKACPVEVPYLRVANVHRRRLELGEVKNIRVTEAELKRTQLRDGDLLFVEGHANPDEVGRVAMWSGEIDLCVHQNHLIRGRVDVGQLLPGFALAWLNSRWVSSYFRRAGKTTSGLNTINTSQVRAAPMAIPPLEDQQQYVYQEARVNDCRRRGELALAQADEMFSSLQALAFRGEL